MTATSYDANTGLNVRSSSGGNTGHMPTRGSTEEVSHQSLAQPFISPGSPSSSSSTSKKNGDTTFEPTIDMMVNDFDDEQTLEEEEALAATESEDPVAELSSLQKESDMPIEELLALYNCAPPPSNMNRFTKDDVSGKSKKKTTSTSSASRSDGCRDDDDDDEEEEFDDDDEDDDTESKEQSQLRKLYPETYGSSGEKRLLRTLSRQSEEEDDGDYSPDEDEFKKTIMVGGDFQAVIPVGFIKYDDALPYENVDKLLWDPRSLSEKQTEDYLQKVQQSKSQNLTGIDAMQCGNHLRDDEQALYILLQCGHNAEEALRRQRINVVPSIEQMSIWSEEECRNFESGLRLYGKDFHTIKQAKVKTRSVGELVQFYYLWKKTERHDVFANKARLDKKKYSLHPGLTDYMDRFIEEQDSNGNGGGLSSGNNPGPRDRSSSPGIAAYLQQTDTKRTNPSRSTAGSSGTEKNSRKRLSNNYTIKNTERNVVIPPDPLAVGDAEVFTGLKNTMHKNCSKINYINPSSVKDDTFTHSLNQ